MSSTQQPLTLSADQQQALADLTVEARRAIAHAPAGAYAHGQQHPELGDRLARADWERAVYLNRLQDLLLAVETTLGLPPQNLRQEAFGEPPA